ncbi:MULTISPECIES: hypothetical protein [unclassified Delftia]|uniref:hypothetical protein n=1 Tax=unclassified Delftia TaxID=2613839 RepID=UPI0009E06F33|nr:MULTISPECIES: hypothetical protein [unclassified Delftia]MDC2862436.1 hypothetical protein [Delftia sp. DT-2]
MRELVISEMEVVNGGTDWGEVGTGLAGVGLGIAIVSTPVGIIGLLGAGLVSYWGGVAIGDGLIDGKAFDFDGDA